MSDTPTDEYARGQREERERFAAYLEHFERTSRDMADQAGSEESRVYQTTIANAMKAMQQAIVGGFHWQDGWRKDA